MRLSKERRRVTWSVLGGLWLFAALLLALHAAAMRDHLTLVGRRGLRGAASAQTPLKAAYPPGSIDTQVWMRHALALLDRHDVRLRHTDIDNAPFGREVHWNSAWAWTIAGAGWIEHERSGDAIAPSLERMTIWLQPAVLLVLLVALSSYAALRAGAAAGAAVAIAMVGHDYFYSGFLPSNVDHHGLLSAAVFGAVLGACFMGAGWWQERSTDARLLPQSPDAARRAAVFSALCGAFGLWISAASVVVPIAVVGASGLAAALVAGRNAIASGARFDARAWRLWGRVGGAASLAFYVLEYFPSHLGFRLEVNHPLYALAWWGGGELIAEVAERWLGPADKRMAKPMRVLAPFACIALAPLTIAIGGTRVFALVDPFMAHLHGTYITEFTPLWTALGGLSWNPYTSVVGIENVPLLAGIGLLAMHGRRVAPIVWFAVLGALVLTAMEWVQMRWMLTGSGFQIALALVLVAHFTVDRTARVRWVGALSAFGVLFVPGAINRVVDARAAVNANRVDQKEDLYMLYRDIAATLRASQPNGDITLLASPNASPSIGYYGLFKSVGTFYWENAVGVKAAAAMFAARTPDEAAALMREREVTHVVMVSDADFVGSYYKLLHPAATDAEIEQSFAYRLLYGEHTPQWLQAVPYQVPDDLAALDVRVLVFRVAFDQSANDALYHAALSEAARGDLTEAGRDFDSLLVHDPKAHQLWIGKSGVLFAQRDWDGAADAALRGVANAPQADHVRLYEWIADSFLRARQTAQAMHVYRTALAEAFHPDIACALAFALATSGDDHLRNGAEAVTLGRRAVAARPESPVYLNCLGAALAETGRFAEAVSSAQRAASVAHAQGDFNAERISQQLLAMFRAGKPWRE
jgi:tetratricopeptide (TPR) repeat protein